jgi:hypothetical protein
VTPQAFLVRFLLGLAGSAAGLSLLLGCVMSTPRTEAKVLGAVAERGTSIETRVAPVAAALARKPVDVRCWSTAKWPRLTRKASRYANGTLNAATLAFADIGGTRINLSPTVCDALVDPVDRNLRPSDDAGQLRLASALVTLAHEPQHSEGIAVEAHAECNAIQLAPRAAASLGIARAYTGALLQTYWRHDGGKLPEYRSSECRRGGTLDLHRADAIWP